jgi:hypothetical protein
MLIVATVKAVGLAFARRDLALRHQLSAMR